MPALYEQTLSELSSALDSGSTSSAELMQAVIDRTQAVDAKVKAFLTYDADDALAQAKASDERRAAGNTLGPLDGIPIGIKDLLTVKDQLVRCSSKILDGYRSPFDATAVAFLRKQGAIIWGRLNMDEFAMGSSTETSAYQKTCNPWDLERIPGGSSGGSAAAVAAGSAPATLGSDTGGSIRQPAALCGIVGMKPTYGLVSRYGLVAFASSLDQIGPMTHTVEDAAILLQGIAGHDPRDSTSVQADIPDYRAELSTRKGPWKLGLPKEYFGEGLDPEVQAAVEQVKAFYEQQGCEIVEVSLPHTEYALSVYYIIATAEASSNLARFDGVRYGHRSERADGHVDMYFKTRGEGFGEEVKRRIILGTYVLSSGYYDAYYLRAQKVRTLIRNDFLAAYEQVDAILTPTSPTTAFKLGERTDNPLAMYLCDTYTIPTNLAGLPGISVPCGFDSKGLPIGFQLIGKPFGESELLAIANRYDSEHGLGRKFPEL